MMSARTGTRSNLRAACLRRHPDRPRGGVLCLSVDLVEGHLGGLGLERVRDREFRFSDLLQHLHRVVGFELIDGEIGVGWLVRRIGRQVEALVGPIEAITP